MKKLIWLLVVAAIFSGCTVSNTDEDVITLILVRHAEKVEDGSEDPDLTEKGEARAQMLAGMMKFKGLEMIYSTPFERNLSTVIPSAKTLDISINEYDPSRDLSDFLSYVVERHPGERVLICGHSNTIPEMLNVLSGEDTYEQLDEDDYDNIYYVKLAGVGKAEITEMTYEPKNWEE